MAKHVYLVRHGESNANYDGIHYGPSTTLTERGLAQADFVGERIKRVGVDALISSSYIRTLETAQRISQKIGLPIEASDLFVERRSPTFAFGKSIHDVELRAVMQEIFEGYAREDHRHSDEENFLDLRARAFAALEFLESYPAERVCVVTHGLFLRVLFCTIFFGTEFKGIHLQQAFRSLETSNTGISYFKRYEDDFGLITSERWHIVNWNDVSHLT